MRKKALMTYLEEHFGISSEEQLNIALRNAEKLNIGIMTTRRVEDDRDTRTERVAV